MDEEDEGSKFCEEDIDQILQRRTQTITIETEGKGSTFAKASFVAAGNRTDISLEDPDFWQKWAKKAELDLDAIHGRNTLVIDTPRVRKQTRHFSSAKEDEMMEFSELESDGEEPSRPTTKPPQAPGSCPGVPQIGVLQGGEEPAGLWRPLRETDVETICRALLAYCLLHYRGDENIKSFIWDLIAPTPDGSTKTLSNHSGLSTPVPRGRKGKKGKLQAPPPQTPRADWLAGCNPDHLLQEDSYKRHLKHHCNKVLLRVRMLYYLRQEVIGDQADRILEGADISDLDVWIPQPLHAEVPADWWNAEADKSLLIGVFKHGYEKYNSMRADPGLYFLERVGMPDAKAIAAEQRGADMMTDGVEGEEEDPEYKPLRMTFKDEMDEFTNSPLEDAMETDPEAKSGESGRVGGASGPAGRLYWPAASALTARLRRLVTACQRSNRRELLRQEALRRPDGRRRRRFTPSLAMMSSAEGGAAYLQEGGVFMAEGGGAYLAKSGPFVPEAAAHAALMGDSSLFFKERRQRWTRREEADFYRVVSTFGVVFHTQRQGFDWAQFRAFARLDKKTDESLEKYYYSFIAMCKRVCRMHVKTDTELPDPTLIIDPITEERASRTLYRIELLRRIREQVLPHPLLTERLLLCQPSPDLPDWWECGRHDHDLLLGASRHGVSRTDYHILNDPQLAFLEAHRHSHAHKGGAPPRHTPAAMADNVATPLLTPAEMASAASAAAAAVAKEEAKEEVKEEDEEKEVEEKKGEEEEEKKEVKVKDETEGETQQAGDGKEEAVVVEEENKEDLDSPKKEVKKEEMEVLTLTEEEQKDTSTAEEKKPSEPIGSDQDQEETRKKGGEEETREEGEEEETTKSPQKEGQEEPEEEGRPPASPKSPTTERSQEEDEEEEEEEKMDEDDKSEKSSQAEASAPSEQKNFDEESIVSLTASTRDETRDGFGGPDELPEPSALPGLQERSYAFSFWPKDRVMINRMDNICDAILKGKWPVNRRQLFDFPGNLLPGYGAAATSATAVAPATESPLQRRSLAELSMAAAHAAYSGSDDITLSPARACESHTPTFHEDPLSTTVPRQRRRRRRKVEIEAERAAKRRNLMDMVAQLRESHAATDTQNHAMDLTKGMHHKAATSLAGFSNVIATSPSLKAQMELLQQQVPPSGHRANGSLDADLPIMRRRRGRRKNVEGLEMLFMDNKRGGGGGGVRRKIQDKKCSQMRTPRAPRLLEGRGVLEASRAQRGAGVSGQSPAPRPPASAALQDGETAAASNQELRDWLQKHPSYTMDMTSFTPKSDDAMSQLSKPKQKRHRCRNPNKIDINTLTGEERVPVVNRRNGRKIDVLFLSRWAGAMAPPMKELSRWLLENPEFAIAPDWTDIVKQSGFLPEAMFDRLLTGPVVREEGVRRRGRRPKSEIAKAAAAAQAAAASQAAQATLASAASSTGGLNPLLLNSLLGGMDLSSLQSLQSLQLAAGLMAFPPSSDPNAAAAAASMLPLMLPGMGGLSNMFSLGGLFGGNLATAAAAAAAAASSSSPYSTTATLPPGNGTLEGGEEEEEEEAGSKRKRDGAEEEEEGGEGGGAQEGGAEGKKTKKRKRESEEKSGSSVATSQASDPTSDPAVLNGDTAALLAGLSANSLTFNPFLLSGMAPGLFYPSMFLPPGLAALGLQGFPSASANTLAELQNAMATASAVATATSNLTPRKEGGARGEEQGGASGEAAKEGGVSGGLESDLGGDREEEEGEETGGEGDDSPMEEGRGGEGEQDGSEKDKSD
ncbi:Chromodomain-helicase-DNA-binding protein 7 [Merluccius polli]|uniref:Chromodomain-helicase-DNA-binding protein 7 n=1 Tax=Merluccius polli TaxID=89951 RepID=A0AA47MRL3_MERPO|nr:Chromodomain-helicase-DNA-binding protein 7 [Merluccius polli]